MTTRTCFAVAAALALAACSGDSQNDEQALLPDTAAPLAAAPAGTQFTMPDTSTMQHSGTGLYWKDVKEGEGEPVQAGQTAVVHYTGWLPDGTKFDSSRDRGEPYAVENLGQAAVIAGWNEGLQGMRPGGQRIRDPARAGLRAGRHGRCNPAQRYPDLRCRADAGQVGRRHSRGRLRAAQRLRQHPAGPRNLQDARRPPGPGGLS